jgi:hypothetical protein
MPLLRPSLAGPRRRWTIARKSHLKRAADALKPAIVHVRSHLRQRQKVFMVMTLANVSMIVLLQNGHVVGRVTSPDSE